MASDDQSFSHFTIFLAGLLWRRARETLYRTRQSIRLAILARRVRHPDVEESLARHALRPERRGARRSSWIDELQSLLLESARSFTASSSLTSATRRPFVIHRGEDGHPDLGRQGVDSVMRSFDCVGDWVRGGRVQASLRKCRCPFHEPDRFQAPRLARGFSLSTPSARASRFSHCSEEVSNGSLTLTCFILP